MPKGLRGKRFRTRYGASGGGAKKVENESKTIEKLLTKLGGGGHKGGVESKTHTNPEDAMHRYCPLEHLDEEDDKVLWGVWDSIKCVWACQNLPCYAAAKAKAKQMNS